MNIQTTSDILYEMISLYKANKFRILEYDKFIEIKNAKDM